MILSENLVTWNVGSTKKLVEELLRMIKENRPAKIELQEVADRHRELEEVAKLSGYRLTQFDDGDHSSSLATLTRPDIEDHNTPGIEPISPRTFVGRLVAGARRTGYTKPKWMLYSRPNFLGLSWVVASTHLVPSHQVKKARELATRQVAVIVAWVLKRPRMVLLAGDFNGVPSDTWGVLSALRPVLDLLTVPSRKRRAIDHWWIPLKRLAQHGITASVQALLGYGSDHRPVMLTLTREIPDPPPEEHECPKCGKLHTPPTV